MAAIPSHLAQYVEYIRNTGQRPLACSAFDEDWSPVGPMVRAQLVAAALIEEWDGGLMLIGDDPPPNSLKEHVRTLARRESAKAADRVKFGHPAQWPEPPDAEFML